jgi:nicotinamide mononucleotide adenylyltransferase
METPLDKLGVVVGRFQVFHNDHLKYLFAGLSLCQNLVVAITNPDPSRTNLDTCDPIRHLEESNPLTYFERYTLIKAVLFEHGVASTRFSIVPFPINIPDLYYCYLPLEAIFYLTIYDSWGRKKMELLQKHGFRTHVIWEKPPNEKKISGSDVRRLIASGGQWEHLVPKSVAKLVNEWNLAKRLQSKHQQIKQ